MPHARVAAHAFPGQQYCHGVSPSGAARPSSARQGKFVRAAAQGVGLASGTRERGCGQEGQLINGGGRGGVRGCPGRSTRVYAALNGLVCSRYSQTNLDL